MRQKRFAEDLRTLLRIRELQRKTAEAKAASAAGTRRTAAKALTHSEEERSAIEHAWLAEVSGLSLHLDAARLWCGALLRQDATVRNADKGVVRATENLSDAAHDWHTAHMRRDVTRHLTRKAWNDYVRGLDERALSEALDRHALQRRDS